MSKIDRAALRALCAKAGTDQMSDTFIDTHAARVELMEDAISTIPALLDALDAAEARERKLREALMTIKTAAGNVVWNAGRGVRAAGSEYDRCWEHVSSTACAALAETAS